MKARESFAGLLLAEWVKLRSVSRWMITLIGAVVLTVGLSYLAASANRMDIKIQAPYSSGPHGESVSDAFFYVHQQVTGDVTLTVRVASLTPSREGGAEAGDSNLVKFDDPSPFAQPAAGIMIKSGTVPGSSYASVMLTPSQGVRMQWDFTQDRKGSDGGDTRWLRLVRSGGVITGYESADGASWQSVGAATPASLPSTVDIGFYVSSPADVYTSRGGGSSSVGERPALAQGVFDNVQLTSGGPWRGDLIGNVMPTAEGDVPADRLAEKNIAPPGRFAERDGTFTVSGTGMIGAKAPDDDMVAAALIGVIAGLIALIAVGVLYATAEYRRGMIRSTFAATPRRGRVLAAKALVLGGVSFLAGLVGAAGSFLVGIPVLAKQGFIAPAFPRPSFADGSVIRVLLLTAAFMAGTAVVGLAIGTLLRQSAAAITVTIMLVLVPLVVGMILPGSSPKWLMYTTLAGGLATQRAKPPTITLAEPWALIGPWAGIGVVAAWVAVTLGLAWLRLRRRDA